MLLEELKPEISSFLVSENIPHNKLKIVRKGSHQCVTDEGNVFIKVNRSMLPAQNSLNAAINIGSEMVQPLYPSLLALPNDYFLTIWKYLNCESISLTRRSLLSGVEDLVAIHQTLPIFDFPNGNLLEEVLLKRANHLANLEVAENVNCLVKKYISPIYQNKQKSYLTHGDAHLNNLVSINNVSHWIDYEQVKIAPREWDISCLIVDLEKKNPSLVTDVLNAFEAAEPINKPLLDNLILGRKLSVITHIANRQPKLSWLEIANMVDLETQAG